MSTSKYEEDTSIAFNFSAIGPPRLQLHVALKYKTAQHLGSTSRFAVSVLQDSQNWVCFDSFTTWQILSHLGKMSRTHGPSFGIRPQSKLWMSKEDINIRCPESGIDANSNSAKWQEEE